MPISLVGLDYSLVYKAALKTATLACLWHVDLWWPSRLSDVGQLMKSDSNTSRNY